MLLTFLLWYGCISLVGWLTFPLAYLLLPGLPDRGYAFSRSLGFLLWGYFFWLLASLGVLRNDTGSLLSALVIIAALVAWSMRRVKRSELTSWLRAHKGLVIGVELLFLAAFAGWTVVRAANPEIFGTEKPMEVAFINAILRSPTFPPNDPWLSGYSISYYYFGYILVAMLAKLTGMSGSVAFNLGISLVFALSALGAYGVLFNLIERLRKPGGQKQKQPMKPGRGLPAAITALLGPFLILLVSNIEGTLEAIHARGLLPAGFWRWLDIQDLTMPASPPFSWLPRLYGTGSWWWWRASRVVGDFDLAGNPKEIIDEFPFFSYLLADLHPHVLAMPFAFLAMALGLNLLMVGNNGNLSWFRRRFNVRSLAWLTFALLPVSLAMLWIGLGSLSLRLTALGAIGLISSGVLVAGLRPVLLSSGAAIFTRNDLGEETLGMQFRVTPENFLLTILVLGGLAFLNTWDFPFYVVLVAGAYALQNVAAPLSIEIPEEVDGQLGRSGLTRALARDFIGFGLLLGVGGVMLYIPFYLGFSSQAGGIIPNLIYPTRGAHLWVMFATMLAPLLVYLIYLGRKDSSRADFRAGFSISIGLALSLWVLALLFAYVIFSLPGLGDLYLSSLSATDTSEVVQMGITRRLASPGGWVTLVILLGFVSAVLWSTVRTRQQAPSGTLALEKTHIFTMLLVLLGGLLILAPEFFFLRDQFGWRINTIFKFYYQAWLLLGSAAAFSIIFLSGVLKGVWGLLYRLGVITLLAMGLVYTIFGLLDKTYGFSPPEGWSLDGAAHLERQAPDEMAAIRWLQSAPLGVVAEAVGGSYTEYARVSAFSGQPTVLGWPGHEGQWRGGGEEMGSRQADIQRLYCTRDWEEARMLLQQYNIRYIFVGGLERTAYNSQTCPGGLSQDKFDRFLHVGFQQGQVTVYTAP